jgi:hypothetical protein
MNEETKRRVHAWLDGAPGANSASAPEAEALASYQQALERLRKQRASAPAGLGARIMAGLPAAPDPTFATWLLGLLPQRRQWLVPATVGALLMLGVIAAWWRFAPPQQPKHMLVHFQIHAPGAAQVDLVGEFNHWRPGVIRLQGPDASGHWTTEVSLPDGQYEYQFLVDGKTWVTDPNAPVHRPDGFGRQNAVVVVCADRS